MYMKKGCKVVTVGRWAGLRGIVTRVKVPKNATVEDHGTIELRVTEVTDKEKYSWLNVGDLEHFVFYRWEDSIKIVG